MASNQPCMPKFIFDHLQRFYYGSLIRWLTAVMIFNKCSEANFLSQKAFKSKVVGQHFFPCARKGYCFTKVHPKSIEQQEHPVLRKP